MKKIDNDLYISLGKTLREARERRHLSLSQVGEMVGRHKGSIMRYEKGTSRIDMETLDKLCQVYGLTLNDLPKPTNDLTLDERLVKAYRQADARTQSIVRQLLELE